MIFQHCTHAILLIGRDPEDSTLYEENLADWRKMMARNGVEITAELDSVLAGENRLLEKAPILQAELARLERGAHAHGAGFEAVVNHVAEIIGYSETELAEYHLAHAPPNAAQLHLPAYLSQQGVTDGIWQPEHLRGLLQDIAPREPLAVYGRLVNWLLAALAIHTLPAPLWIFDARLGWTTLPQLPWESEGAGEVQAGWQTRVEETAEGIILHLSTQGGLLDIEQPERLPLPLLPPSKRVIVSGAVPTWLLTAAVRQFVPSQRQLAVYQPRLGKAVVVWDAADPKQIGKLV